MKNKLPNSPASTDKLIVSQSSLFQGPLPPPAVLKEYDNAVSNGAERVLAMAERQSAHRIELEKIAITAQLNESKRGQNFALVIGLAGLASAVILSILGHDIVAGACLTAPIFSLATAFIRGKSKQAKELKDKQTVPQ